MDLSTRYLGFALPHPLVPGAGPLADDLDLVRRLEDAGAPLVALRSLFEEQVVVEQLAHARALDAHSESFAEASGWFPDSRELAFGPEEYLEHLGRIKAAVRVPVVASLNGTTPGGWIDFAQRIAQAGADAIELNLHDLATDPAMTSGAIEARHVEVVREIRRRVRLPLAVKLSPFFTALPNFATELVRAGADAIVLFNRFYEPEIDLESLEVKPELHLSSRAELNLRLRWIAILHGRVDADLAVTGGVHSAVDAVKALLAGAHAVQVVSALLRHGPEHLATLRRELDAWLESHDYAALAPSIGSLSHGRGADPRLIERANYARILHAWRPR